MPVTCHDIEQALESWAVVVLGGEPLSGWPRITSLGRIIEEGPTGAAIRPCPGPRMPDVRFGGRYWAVARVLVRPELKPECRVVACIEAGLLNGMAGPSPNIAKRARVAGMSEHTYRRRLHMLRQYIGWELARAEHQQIA